MPTRLLREGILDSDSVNSLSWEAEIFYRRLMSVVDDHGIFDARATVLKGRLYALKPDVRATDITRWLTECETAGLIACYEAEGKPYVLFHKLGKPRSEVSKYPSPPSGLKVHLKTSEYSRKRLQTDVPYSDSYSSSNSDASAGADTRSMFEQFWHAYPKKTGNKEAAFEEFADIGPDDELLGKMLRAVAWFKGTKDWTDKGGQFITAPEKWLKNGRWTEAPDHEKPVNETLKFRQKAEEEKAKALPPAELSKAMKKLASGGSP